MADRQDSKWKEKCLRSLDELEQKERQWAELEELLRRAVGRLAHAGYGMDRALDRQLDRVRDAVRGKRDASTLERLAREASDTAVGIQEAVQRESSDMSNALADLLHRLPLQGTSKKQAERLCKDLKGAAGLDQIRPLVGRIAALIEQTGGQEPQQPPTEPAADAPPPPPPRGLLSRLIGTRTAPASPTPAVPPSPPQPAACAQVMERFLDRLESGSGWTERLASLRRQAAACRQEAEAYRLLDETAAVVSEILQVADQAGPDARMVVESLPSAGDALLELMEKIEIPPQLQERVGVIKNSLAQASTPNQVRIVVESIAELLGAVRREVQEEKQDLENFLEGVTSRIQILSEHVAELGTHRESSAESRDAFHLSFRDHMDGIRNSMRETDDVTRLKQAIETGLDAIETQMEAYVRREDAVSREAQERIDDLSSRLHDMNHEALLLQQQMQQQRELAMKDPLTGVYNRLAYEERIEAECGRWRRYGDPLSMIVLDVDHFKRINDSFGHLAGDKALRAMALRVLQNVREVDVVARYGGEEFVVIMPNTAAEQAFTVAEKLRSVIAAAGFHYNKQPVNITVSCGVASFREGDEPQDVFSRADEALYAAKQAGRNCTERETPHAAEPAPGEA